MVARRVGIATLLNGIPCLWTLLVKGGFVAVNIRFTKEVIKAYQQYRADREKGLTDDDINRKSIASAAGEKRFLWKVNEYSISIQFEGIGAPEQASSISAKEFNRPTVLLAGVVGKIRLMLETSKPKRQTSSALFTATEIIAMFGDKAPNPENIQNIRRLIIEQKFYPMPTNELPSEKSSEAQGHTKKPGSHSESRHR